MVVGGSCFADVSLGDYSRPTPNGRTDFSGKNTPARRRVESKLLHAEFALASLARVFISRALNRERGSLIKFRTIVAISSTDYLCLMPRFRRVNYALNDRAG